MMHSTLSKKMLKDISDFLDTVSETNEDTEYDQSKDYLIDAIQILVKEKDKTSVVEDFEVPYLHPMITVQKWNAELKQIVLETISENQAHSN